MVNSDPPDTGGPGNWPRPLRLALDSIVTMLMNACMMARSRAAGSLSKIVRVLAERDEALVPERSPSTAHGLSAYDLLASELLIRGHRRCLRSVHQSLGRYRRPEECSC